MITSTIKMMSFSFTKSCEYIINDDSIDSDKFLVSRISRLLVLQSQNATLLGFRSSQVISPL